MKVESSIKTVIAISLNSHIYFKHLLNYRLNTKHLMFELVSLVKFIIIISCNIPRHRLFHILIFCQRHAQSICKCINNLMIFSTSGALIKDSSS